MTIEKHDRKVVELSLDTSQEFSQKAIDQINRIKEKIAVMDYQGETSDALRSIEMTLESAQWQMETLKTMIQMGYLEMAYRYVK